MHKMAGKKIVCVCAAAVLFLFSMKTSLVRANADPQTAKSAKTAQETDSKKIISIAYDDSYSMVRKGTWSYCNYAFQLFASLCEGVEDFYVTYMSSDLSSSNLFANDEDMQVIVDKIRSTYGEASSTPITSVETAFNKLLTVEDTAANDEYWLVVMSDGVFNSGVTESGATDITTYLNECAEVEMPNGTNVNIIYMSIGNEAAMPNAYEEKQIYVQKATNREEIATALVDIAKNIFGYIEVADNGFINYRKKDGNTIEMDSPLKLEEIMIIFHGSQRQMDAADVSGGSSQPKASAINLNYPVRSNIPSDSTLIGTRVHVKDETIIPKGSYAFHFTEDITNDELMILVKADLKVQLTLYSSESGEEISDYDRILQSEKLDIQCRMVEQSTGKEISKELWQEPPKYRIIVSNNGELLEGCEEDRLEKVGLRLDTMYIRGTAVFEGNTLNTTEVIAPVPHVVYEIKGYTRDSGRYSADNMAGRSLTANFEIYGNGEKLSRKEIKELDLRFYGGRIQKMVKLDRECHVDGTLTISGCIGSRNPLYRIFLGWVPAWVQGRNAMNITARIYSAYDDAVIENTVAVKLAPGNSLLQLWHGIQPFLLLVVICGYFFKKRFEFGARISCCHLQLGAEKMTATKYDWKTRELDEILMKCIHSPMAKNAWFPFVSDRVWLDKFWIAANSYPWTKKKSVRIRCQDEAVKEIKLIDTSTISVHEDLDLKYHSSRIREDYTGRKKLVMHYQEGILFVYEKEAVIYKITI